MKLRHMQFRAPDEGGSPGAAAFAEPAAPAPSSEPPPAASNGEPVAQPPLVNATELAQQFASSIGEVLKGQQASTEPPLTPEEAKKLLKIWEPDDDWYKRYDNLETRKQAMLEMRDGIVAQVDTLGQYRARDLANAIRGEFQPAVEFATRAEQRERDNDFKEMFPDLGKPELKPLVKAVRDQFTAEKRSFNSEADYHKAVGEAVVATIKVVHPEFKLTSGGSTPPRSSPDGRIPVTTPGSAGGGGHSGEPAKATKLGLQVFSK